MDNAVIAGYWEQYKSESKDGKESKVVKCLLCPHYCIIKEDCSGKCGARTNVDGKLIASAYGLVSSIALDPIEKKPLYEFHSGSKILSIGSYGCNFHCPFCQNHSISMEYENVRLDSVTPEDIADLAKQYRHAGNIGVAYTYNEPLINFEFIKDCSVLTRKAGLVNILVTNGYINEEPLAELLPYIDAMNVDIKGSNSRTYKTIGGTQEVIMSNIELAVKSCHIEITTLVIPGENEDDAADIAKWIGSIDKKIPYHLSRFFPRYKYSSREPTPYETMYRLKEVAGKYLDKVYLGNI